MQRWSGLQGYYDEQRTNVSNIHQQLHTALAESDVIKADEITASNGRVYVTLDDQVFSGGQLSSKGRKAIADFAGVLKDKQDLVVDVASANSYAAYWNNGGTTTGSAMGNTDASTSTNTSTDANSSSTTDANSATAGSNTNSNSNQNATAATDNTSSRPTARTSTTTHKSSATARKSSTATRSSRATASKSSSSKSTARKSESGRKMSFKSSSASKSTNSWSSNIAKATAIAKELHKNGVYNVGLMVPGSENATDAGTTTSKKNFQLIVSPKGDRYYQMIESNSPKNNGTQGTGTQGTQGTGTGTGSGSGTGTGSGTGSGSGTGTGSGGGQ